MDPNTVVITLAVNLIASGVLYRIIARSMPPGSGLSMWAVGAVTMGAVYLTRLIEGLRAPTLLSSLLDPPMVAAALLLAGGMRRFIGLEGSRVGRFAALLALYALAEAAAIALWGMQGRFVLLNVVLGLTWGGIAAVTVRTALAGREPVLRVPLLAVGVMLGGLGAMTLWRSTSIARLGLVAMYGTPQSALYYAYATLATAMLSPTLLWMVFVRLHGQLAELASHDALTRLLNRNGLDEALRRHFAAREPAPVTLLQLDLDHFKRINDVHGHAAGDAVLRAVAAALARHVRGSDFVARTGGEEFVIGCVGADEPQAHATAERLREAVAALRIGASARDAADAPGDARAASRPRNAAGAALSCTASIGLSRPFARLADWENAWREADDALYAAKAAGRNRVRTFASLPAAA